MNITLKNPLAFAGTDICSGSNLVYRNVFEQILLYPLQHFFDTDFPYAGSGL